MAYPLEVYKPGAYRVIWSPEEHAAVLTDGWSNQRPVDEEKPQHLAESTESYEASAALYGSAAPAPKRRGRPPRFQSEVA